MADIRAIEDKTKVELDEVSFTSSEYRKAVGSVLWFILVLDRA